MFSINVEQEVRATSRILLPKITLCFRLTKKYEPRIEVVAESEQE